jgi:hypothetical protein
MLATRIRPEVEAAIRDEVERALVGLPFNCVVRARHDHDGDEAIYVDVTHQLSARAIDIEIISNLLTDVNDRVHALDERRFTYVRHHFHDDQTLTG